MSQKAKFEHLGNESIALIPNTDKIRQRLSSVLSDHGFRKTDSTIDTSEWKRSGSFVWWPVRVLVDFETGEIVLSAQMSIPWFTIWLPVAGLLSAAPFVHDYVLVTCAKVLAAFVLIVAVVPRLRRFDLSPCSFWQGLGRRIWARRLEAMFQEICSCSSSE